MSGRKKRKLTFSDGKDSVKVTLWGERAEEVPNMNEYVVLKAVEKWSSGQWSSTPSKTFEVCNLGMIYALINVIHVFAFYNLRITLNIYKQLRI